MRLDSFLNNSECNSFICTGDFNASFERGNAHCKYQTALIERNNSLKSMKHALSEPYYTYTNHALGHYSTIDHCNTTSNIFDRIIKCYVICEPLAPFKPLHYRFINYLFTQ